MTGQTRCRTQTRQFHHRRNPERSASLKHCDPQEHPAPSTPLGPSGLSWPVPCMLPVPLTHSRLSLLTPLAELLLHPVGSATHQGSTGIIQPPMDEPLFLYQLLSSKHFSNWPSRSGTVQCHAPRHLKGWRGTILSLSRVWAPCLRTLYLTLL